MAKNIPYYYTLNSLLLYPLVLVLDIIKENYCRCQGSTSKSIFYALNF